MVCCCVRGWVVAGCWLCVWAQKMVRSRQLMELGVSGRAGVGAVRGGRGPMGEVRWRRVPVFVLCGWVSGRDVFHSRERYSNEVDCGYGFELASAGAGHTPPLN